MHHQEIYGNQNDKDSFDNEYNNNLQNTVHQNQLHQNEETEVPMEYVKQMVRTWSIDELWPNMKFVEAEHIQTLDLNEDIHQFTTLFVRMNMNNDNIYKKQIFLNTYADTIRKIINEYRASAQEQYKRDILKRKSKKT